MFVVVLLLVRLVITSGPGLFFESTGGVLVETLAAELWTAVAHTDGFGVAALLDDRGNAVELRHFGGARKALPVGAEGHQQSRGQGGTGARKTAKDGRVRVLVHGLGNGFIQVLDGFEQGPEHGGPALTRAQAGSMIAPSVVSGLAAGTAWMRCSIRLALRLLCL